MPKVTITQVLNRTYDEQSSYIACAKNAEDGQSLRFIGTGLCPFSEFATYNVDFTSESVKEPNKIHVDSSTMIEQCDDTPNLSKLVDVKNTENNGRLNTVKSVVVYCEEAQDMEGGGKRRKMRVVDESVGYPMNVMAYKDAAEGHFAPGEVVIFHRPKVYAPEGSEYRGITIYDKPTKSGNDKGTEELQELYRNKYAEKDYEDWRGSIGELQMASETLCNVELTGIVVKIDTVTSQETRGGKAGAKFQSVYVADKSNKYINCVSFNELDNDMIACDKVVRLKLCYNDNGKRKNFVVKQVEIVKDTSLQNWWSTMMWTDLLPAFENEVRDEKTVQDVETNCKEWVLAKKRVSVRGKVTRTDQGVRLSSGGHEIVIKEINCELPADITILVENAPVNELGITVFPDTKFSRLATI
tara:strand:- start:1513 stop:2751 length:1239 start_codon:yes stop_codon:yes gene_type:complete